MKTIVWDIDDVLNDLMRDWFCRGWLPAHPDCKVTYEDIKENPPHRILNIRLEEYLRSLDAFRAAEGPILEPVPESVGWFHAHGHNFRHIALTSVPLRSAHISAEWVMKHFGKWIRSFNMVPSPRADETIPAYDQNKGEFLEWWGRADLVVDDNTSTIEAAMGLGIQTAMMPRPWNTNPASIPDTFDLIEELF